MFDEKTLRVLNDLVDGHPYPLLFATVSGAHLYGFESPDSDFDLRGAHLTPAAEIAGLNPPEETVTKSGFVDGIEADAVSHEIRKFMRQMLKPNGYVLEQLYSPLVIRSTPWHEELKALGKSCITRRHTEHYEGFAKGEWGRFAKGGSNLKSLLYVYRVTLTGIQLMRTGEILCHLPTLAEEYGQGHLVELIQAKRTGPEKADMPAIDLALHERRFNELFARIAIERERSPLPELHEATAALRDLLKRIRYS